MKGGAARKRGASASGRQAEGLDEARTECRRIAGELSAAGFAAFAVTAGAERRLEPCFAEAEHVLPGLLGRVDGDVARHALASSAPFWWEGAKGHAGRLAALPWAVRTGFEGLDAHGVGFPCSAERGLCGAFVFWGEEVGIDAAGLFGLHARLFALFERIAGLRARGAALPALSPRELECVRLSAKGMRAEQVAAALGLSVNTTNQHLAGAAAKLDAVNRMQMVAKALRLGLID